MILKFSKYSRLITAILAISYLMTGSGLSTLLLQGASHVYATVIFPCKGKGCACDKIGYELKGCKCIHDGKKTTSCCSIDKSTFSESSDKSEEPTFILKAPPCGGQEEDYSHSLAKHVEFELPEPKPFYTWLKVTFTNHTKTLDQRYCLPADKVPIFS